MGKKSKISNFSDDILEKNLKESSSLLEFIRKIGYESSSNGYYQFVKTYLKKKNIEIPKFNKDYNNVYFLRKTPNENIFIENSTYSQSKLKRRIISEKLLEYKCQECGNLGEWNGKKLILQLDHINGISDDHRLINLRFLCPNCHTQTTTFSIGNKEKNIRATKQKHYCIECDTEIWKNSLRCTKCRSIQDRKVERPPFEQLLKEIEEIGYTATGRKYGVSDNTIRKWIKFYQKN